MKFYNIFHTHDELIIYEISKNMPGNTDVLITERLYSLKVPQVYV